MLKTQICVTRPHELWTSMSCRYKWNYGRPNITVPQSVKNFYDKLVNSRYSMPTLRQQLFSRLSMRYFLDNEESNSGRFQNLSAAMPRVGSFHFPVEEMMGVSPWDKATQCETGHCVKLRVFGYINYNTHNTLRNYISYTCSSFLNIFQCCR